MALSITTGYGSLMLMKIGQDPVMLAPISHHVLFDTALWDGDAYNDHTFGPGQYICGPVTHRLPLPALHRAHTEEVEVIFEAEFPQFFLPYICHINSPPLSFQWDTGSCSAGSNCHG